MVNNSQIMSSTASQGRRERSTVIRSVLVPTMVEAIEKWIDHRHVYRDITDNTETFYRTGIKPLLALVGEDTPVSEVTFEDFEEVLAIVKRKGNSTGATYRVTKAFIRWCGRRGMPMDPRFAFGLEAPYTRPTVEDDYQIFKPKQLATLKTELSGSLRNRLIYGLLLGCGPRVSELAKIGLHDLEEHQLHIRFAKGRKHRRVPVSGQLREDWKAYVRKERPEADTDTLLLTERKLTRGYTHGYQPFGSRGIQMMLSRIGKKVGFNSNPHRWRHSFATLWVWNHLRRGEPVDLDQLRRYMGHEDLEVLNVYVNLAKGMVPKGFERYLPY